MAERDEGALVHLLRSVVAQLSGGKLTKDGRIDLVLRTLEMVRLFVGRNLPYQVLEHCLTVDVARVSWFRIPDMVGEDTCGTALGIDLNTVLRKIRGLRVFGPLYDYLHASNQGRPLLFLGQDGLVFIYRGTDPRNGAEGMRIAQAWWNSQCAHRLLSELFEADPEAAKRILNALDEQLKRWVIAQEERLAIARRTFHEVGVMGVLLDELESSASR